jgi:hypothetical protein
MNAHSPSHSIRIADPRPRPTVPEVLMARCSCGWTGPLRVGRNARALAENDGQEHRERVWAAHEAVGDSAPGGEFPRAT